MERDSVSDPALMERPLTELPWAVVDVETTGLSPERGDRVVEIAVLRVEPGQEPALHSSLVDPGRPIDPAASAVNGLTSEDLRGQPRFSELAEGLLERIHGAVLVAHNAPFDLGFLTAELELAGHAMPPIPVIDTLLLARRNYRFRSNRLGSVARAMQIEIDGAHRAGADVRTTHAILCRMLEDLAKRGSISLAQVMKAQGMGPGSFRPRLTEPLATAVREHRAVGIAYRTRGRGATRRVVEPIGMRGPYLVAYCRLRRAERTFRVDRIEGAWWP